ncbi:MAG: Fe-S protein assembly co-chaperone HscB [Georgfuchsia sp.]
MTSVVRDYFTLFNLPHSFSINSSELELRYHDLQSKVHPDKHAHLGDSERRLAMQRATEANAAFRTLKNPLKRADYLLRLAGHDVAIENNTAMPAEFLIEQMELREAVGDARAASEEAELDRLRAELKLRMAEQYALLEIMLDQRQDYAEAADMVRCLMFQEKLLQEIDDALEAIEA